MGRFVQGVGGLQKRELKKRTVVEYRAREDRDEDEVFVVRNSSMEIIPTENAF